MNKFLKCIRNIWEFPQKILALVIIKVLSAKQCGEYQDAKLYRWKLKGGMSLSNIIFIPFDFNDEQKKEIYYQNYVKHEYGHSIQSKYIGIFYLLIIGLPSIIWAGCFEKYRKKHNKSYYDFYTERFADKLGGVERNLD